MLSQSSNELSFLTEAWQYPQGPFQEKNMWNHIDDDDVLLAKALDESLRYYNEVELPRTQTPRSNCEKPTTEKLEEDVHAQPSTSKQSTHGQYSTAKEVVAEEISSRRVPSPEKQILYDGEEAEGFDLQAGKTWLYPKNYPIREYQRSIVDTAMFHNTLVSLPTGLGKTFIAAVVMYNFYKWYPNGKIIFMAPTKPLVAQQVEHCYNTMGIPKKDTAEMTGALQAKDRAALWRGKRVFFLTPQVVQNDLSSGICPAMAVKCVVIDEAHKATGEYAYTQVVKLLQSFGAKFRVLALSATPGSDITAVQKVVSSLMISHIEIRNEDSPDLVAYTHERQIEIMSVSVGPTIIQIREKYLRIMGEYCRKLQASKVLFGNIASLSSFQILKSWNEFRISPPAGMPVETARVLSADFSLLHSLAHGLDLLQNYGLRLLLTNITGVMEDPINPNGARLKRNDELQALLEEIQIILDPPPDNTLAPSQPDFIFGHPKLDALKNVVENHFRDFEARGVQTRVIVFCEYREAVIEIRQLLTALQPLVKPVGFMGQSSGKHGKGISQKNQLLVMEQFRKGIYNTLISTSVGEEGLDIGEVDLIICYDAKNSPIRQVQRMGRTGRKRKGRIIVLVTEGKEELKFRSALAKKKNINAMLVERDSLKGYLLDESPSMIPTGFQTECVERHVFIAPSTASLQQQDLRKMFSRKTTNNSSNAPNRIADNPFVLDEELIEMLPEAMTDIYKAEEYYKNMDLTRYLEWQRFLQYTHSIGHSTSSVIMADLLGGTSINQESNFRELQTQITATQIWPGVKKRGTKRPSSAATAAVKRKKPRTNNDKKLQRPASPSTSESGDDGPMPSYFQAKPGRLCAPHLSPTENKASEDKIPTDADFPLDQPPSPLEMDDSSEDGDLHPEIREAVRKLGIAFRNQDDSLSEDDNCPVCSHLEPCPEITNMMNEDQPKPDVSWNEMEAMLNRVKSIVPRLTQDCFALPSPPESPVFVSMLPRQEFEQGDSFNSGIICGGVGDVSISPVKESENPPEASSRCSDAAETGHLAGGSADSFNFGHVSAASPQHDSKIVKRHSDVLNSPGMNHLKENDLLDCDLDDIFAKIESQTSRIMANGGKATPSDDFATSPILGSQFTRKPRSSSMTPTPKANPRKTLFPIFPSQSKKASPEVSLGAKESDSPPEVSSQRDIQLDFDSFLKSPEERAGSSQTQVSSSPILSKSQSKQKKKDRAKTPIAKERSKSHQSACLSPVVSKSGQEINQSEETRDKYAAFFEKSEEDIFAGLDCQIDVFNVNNAHKVDLDCGFMNRPEKVKPTPVHFTSSPTRKVTPKPTSPIQKRDPSGNKITDLVWMDKSNASSVANIAPPQNRKSSKLSLKKNVKLSKSSIFDKTDKTLNREEVKSPVSVPDCFELNKVTSRSVSKPQPRESTSKYNPSVEEDDFSRKVAYLPLSPIEKLERPITPNSQLDELVKNLPSISSESSPEIHHPEPPEKDSRKRLLSSSPSPEVPRKRQNLRVQSSPESPLFAKPKKGFRRPLDETVAESQCKIAQVQNSPESPLFAKPKKGFRRPLDETTVEENGGLKTKKNSTVFGKKSSTGKYSKRPSLSDSSDEEFAGKKERRNSQGKDRKTKKKKQPKKKKKSSRFAFLESQAVESDEERRNSSDGESTSLDELDSSFIDDSPNETVVDNDTDIQARYLQAVKSPAVKPNAFKIPLPSAIPFRGDVYSQAVDPNDYSCYMNDSFCVDEDVEEVEDPEMSLLEAAEARLKAAKKEKRNQKEKKSREPKKRSRIVRPRDSSDSDDDIQVIETKINKNKQTETNLNKKSLDIDKDLVDAWYDDDFDVPEINDLIAAESTTNQVSTSKSGPSNHIPSSKSGPSDRIPTSKPAKVNAAPLQRTNTDDMNQLLEDDFDFSSVLSAEQDCINDFVETKSKKSGCSSTSRDDPLVIFVSVRQVTSATEILRLLRMTGITPSCRSSTSADYVISRRLGVCRISISDLKSTQKLEPITKRMKESFTRSVLIVENDKENRLLMATKTFKNKGNVSPPKPVQPEWTSGAITTLTHLREASVEILFSDKKAVTARLLADLTRGEHSAGYSIPVVPVEFTNEMEKKLKFLTMIPGINIALAIHLIGKFKTIKSFISNCSTVKDIQRNVGVNHQVAQKIHNILFQVHMS